MEQEKAFPLFSCKVGLMALGISVAVEEIGEREEEGREGLVSGHEILVRWG